MTASDGGYRPLVTMQGIVKRFGSTTAVAGVDFDLRAGEIHALLGENGAGKTTLMNVLYGLEQPDQGTITVDGAPMRFRSAHDAIEVGIGMVHQHFQLVPRLTVAENVILGAAGLGDVRLPDLDRIAVEVEAVGERYGLPIRGTALVEELSVGEQQRVEIIRALHRGARVLILDEPTATLAPVEVDQLIVKLRGMADEGAAIVMITHHLDEVMSAADRVTVLRQGHDIATVRAAETNPLDLARLMVGRDVELLSEVGEGIESGRADRPAVGGTVLELAGLTLEESTGRSYADIDLVVRGGEIVTIAGVEGNGQAELEETLQGLRPATSGLILLADADVTTSRPADLLAAGVGYIHSDRYRRGMITELSVAENLLYHRIDCEPFGGRWWLRPRAWIDRATELVRRFSIAVDSPTARAASLSGGNAQKVVLARALGSELKLLVAAQPTRGLDVGAIEFVWEQLRDHRDAGLAILLLTTDLNEVMALSDRCFVIYRGRLSEAPVDRERIGLAMGGVDPGHKSEVTS